jgi:hypothetical protein
MPRPFDVTREILEDTYDLLLDTGYYIQPWPLENGSLDDPCPTPTRRSAARCFATGRGLAHPYAAAAAPCSATGGVLDDRRSPATGSTGGTVGKDLAFDRRSQWGCQPGVLRDVLCSARCACAQRGSRQRARNMAQVVGRFGQHLVETRLLPRSLGTSLNQMLELRQKSGLRRHRCGTYRCRAGLEPSRSFRRCD